jgi:uncharacterized membrane protein (DUF485 family)
MPEPSRPGASPAPPGIHDDRHPTSARNARYGLWLFGVYVVLYGGFMALSAFRPQAMRQPVAALGGVNLAIVYGFGLIVAALVLALVYMLFCVAVPAPDADPTEEEAGR